MPKRPRIKYESEEDSKLIDTKRRRIKRESEDYSSSELDGSPSIKLDDDMFDSGKQKSAAMAAFLIDPVLESDDDRSPERLPHDVIPSVDRVDASKPPSHKKSKGSKYDTARKKYKQDLELLSRIVVPKEAMNLINFVSKEWENKEEECKSVRNLRSRRILKAKATRAKFNRANVEKKTLADSISQMREQIKTIEGENQALKLKVETLEARELENRRLRQNLRAGRKRENTTRITLRETTTELLEARKSLKAYHAMKEELQEFRKANETMRTENERLEAEVQGQVARIKKQQQMFMAAAMEVCNDGMKSEQTTM